MLDHPFLSEKRLPLPTWMLEAGVILASLVSLGLVAKSGEPIPLGTLALAAIGALLLFLGWRIGTAHPNKGTSNLSLPFVGAGTIAALGAAYLSGRPLPGSVSWILVMPALMLALTGIKKQSLLGNIVVPAAFGAISMFAAASVGHPAVGAFPAAIGALFVAVVRATLEIEQDIFENHADSNNLEVHHHYHRRLAVTAVIFFLFGTVSLWPWLGELYSRGYFWIMLFGVLIPLAFFWGRIRQPKMEGARTALIRFNRIAPVLGMIHAVAFFIS